MSTIELKNIRVFANHGCLTEEEKIGSDYLVNVRVEADLMHAAQTDELDDTIDYVALNNIVKEEMAIRAKLLENVGFRIIERILSDFSEVTFTTVTVSKVNPPIGGDVEAVSVTMTSA
ncbi:7,8-dihydroneopterin aldolase [Patiriisocius marinistellae]|uniref:7,8-dihydroneopterin aldolase n=1 Tax=Patiriisocius marinistellae TaxID=2494560 RepID=A0A5J4FXX0_9FLAO|nr:dihydroneopterin aldolase [Patiriisocius marinistellae]GEQ84885.1 7,8-dihydroneopterin aldolase [Patiriisocius marinistellae]